MPRAGHADETPPELVLWTPDPGAFEPARMRIHPLSRITRGADGEAELVCHLELRDSSNQVVKCLGVASVELPGADEPTPRWEVDLRDVNANADAFDDVVTRTYTLRLGGLPEELERLADAAPAAGAAPVRVRAWFLFKDAAGDVRELEAVRELSGP